MQAYTALSGAINLRDSAYRGNGFSLLLFAPLVPNDAAVIPMKDF